MEEDGVTLVGRKKSQEHHPNRHQKKEKMKITQINNVVDQTAMSILNYNIKKNAGHHHMSVTKNISK
jgi:hypothetical protein